MKTLGLLMLLALASYTLNDVEPLDGDDGTPTHMGDANAHDGVALALDVDGLAAGMPEILKANPNLLPIEMGTPDLASASPAMVNEAQLDNSQTGQPYGTHATRTEVTVWKCPIVAQRPNLSFNASYHRRVEYAFGGDVSA